MKRNDGRCTMDDVRWTICYDCMYTVYYGAPGILSPTQTPTISVCRPIKGVTYQVSMHTSAVGVVQPSLPDLPSYIEYRAFSETPQLNLSYQLVTMVIVSLLLGYSPSPAPVQNTSAKAAALGHMTLSKFISSVYSSATSPTLIVPVQPIGILDHLEPVSFDLP